MSAIDGSTLRRWGATTPTLRPAPGESECKEASKFPVSADVNGKIALCLEDIWWMKVDAIVNTSNESLTDRSGVAGAIVAAAGPELMGECLASEHCRTGEAVITGGGRLPASHVIHTVGPKYNVKYRTAAENALHNCYRNCLRVLKENSLRSVAFPCIYTTKKKYPRSDAAHIAIRSIRRFLENFGEGIELVVICVDNPADLKIYQELMALYLPRDKGEEQAARVLLPKDTGNELGETVIEDRKIRIAALPGVAKTTPVPRPADDAASGAGAGAGASESKGDDRVPAGPREVVPGLRDPDEARLERTRDAGRVADDDEDAVEYDRLLTQALAADLTDIAALNLIYKSGVDLRGNPVLVFVAAHVPAPKVDLKRVLMYLIRVLDEFVDSPFTLVYIHSVLSKPNTPSYQWLSRVHKVLPRAYKKHIQGLFIVHPNFWVKTGMLFLRGSISKRFARKLVYVEQARELFKYFPASHLRLPDSTFKADILKNREVYRGAAAGTTSS